ncbi:hypothetical protein Golob_012029, partial [Gossypium lobatum]|nr:hypothetical protein [Gossypium lobatum]
LSWAVFHVLERQLSLARRYYWLPPFGALGEGESWWRRSFKMAEEINIMLERLKFSKEESTRVISTNTENNLQGFEAWAVGKIMAAKKPNREAMYRVLRSLWFTK